MCYSLHSVSYYPGVLNPLYRGNSLESWLLLIFNSVSALVSASCINQLFPLFLPYTIDAPDPFVASLLGDHSPGMITYILYNHICIGQQLYI